MRVDAYKYARKSLGIVKKARGVYCSSSIEVDSSTVTNSIAFPWLRGVPEGISSGTWGQKTPRITPSQ